MSESAVIRVFVGTRAGRVLAEHLAATVTGGVNLRVTLIGGVRPPQGCTVDRIGASDPGEAAAVIDALDPFDRDPVRALRDKARKAGIARLTYRPRGWERHPLDRWVEVRDLKGAVNAVASVARTALLWLPSGDVEAFETVGGLRFPTRLARMPARWALPPRFEPILAAPPYSVAGDTLLLRQTQAQAVVMRATGAEMDAPLVRAARSLDLPIIMIRPPVERGEVPARSIDVVVDWVDSVVHPQDYIKSAREWR
jgi:precorrin-6A/cobalt-precorrin-6A reductase